MGSDIFVCVSSPDQTRSLGTHQYICLSGLVWSGLVWSDLVWSGLICLLLHLNLTCRWYLDHAENTWSVMYNYDPVAGLSSSEAELVVGGEVAMWVSLKSQHSTAQLSIAQLNTECGAVSYVPTW